MSVFITCKDVSVEFPTKQVLDCVTLGVNTGDRIGIVGANGDGKSTLLGVLAGTVQPTGGAVVTAGSFTVGVLGQNDPFAPDDIVSDILDAANSTVGAYSWKADRAAREIVEELLADTDLDACVSALSGGQRRRVDLARLLVGSWDVLMLDEPTNHLDIRAISWLAEHLKNRYARNAGALLVITHDRWFLDEVCTRMWEVHNGDVIPFEGGYSAYVMQRVERARLEQLAHQKRANQLRKELAWLSRGAQARRTKPKFHVEAARALIADVPEVRDPIELKSMAMTRLGKQVFELMDVCIDRGDKRVLSDITWTIGPGDRLGILGENGAGKSTLLGLLDGTIKPTLGHIKRGRTVHVASLSQGLSELAPFEDDIVRVLLGRYKTYYEVDGRKLTPAKMLERLGFTQDQLNTRVCELSGGQRRRLQFLLTLCEEPNVLILDEPGNDLDTDMLAALEDVLDSWAGTLIAVSHDRHLLERITDDMYAIIDCHVRHMPGGVDEYLRLVHEREQQRSLRQTSSEPTAKQEDTSSLTNAQRHRLRKELASLERKLDTARGRVADARAALEGADPFDYVALGDAQARIAEEQDALEALEEQWLEVSEALQ